MSSTFGFSTLHTEQIRWRNRAELRFFSDQFLKGFQIVDAFHGLEFSFIEHHQHAFAHRFDPLSLQPAHEFRIYRSRIEDHPFWFQGNNVVRIFLLPGGANVDGNGVHILRWEAVPTRISSSSISPLRNPTATTSFHASKGFLLLCMKT